MIKKKGIGITFDGIDEYLSWVDTREIKTDEEIHAAANHHSPNLEKEMGLKTGWLFFGARGRFLWVNSDELVVLDGSVRAKEKK